MWDTIFRVARQVSGVGLICMIVACGDHEAVELNAPEVEIVQAETGTRPDADSLASDAAADVNESEPPGFYEAEEIDEFEVAEEDEAEETDELDELDVAEETDALEVMYENLRALEPIEGDEAMFALENADPMVRARGAWNLEPEGEPLDHLLRLAAYDPDPVVRIAALASLEEGESFVAIKGLIDALQDPDSDVVVAAIDSLEFVGDASNVRYLEPLLWHDDDRVTKAAAEAIDYLSY
jgi:hypothetical protein